MIKTDLVSKIHHDLIFGAPIGCNVPTHEQINHVINRLEKVIMEEVVSGGEVNLRGFGVFKSILFGEKHCNLPKSKGIIKAHRRVRFLPGLIFKRKFKTQKP